MTKDSPIDETRALELAKKNVPAFNSLSPEAQQRVIAFSLQNVERGVARFEKDFNASRELWVAAMALVVKAERVQDFDEAFKVFHSLARSMFSAGVAYGYESTHAISANAEEAAKLNTQS